MNIASLHDVLAHLHQASSSDALTGWARPTIRGLGFDYFSYLLLVPTRFCEAQAERIENWPADWSSRYWAQDYWRKDPVVRYASRQVLPLAWHELTLLTTEERMLMQEAARCGLGAGVSMPVHGASGELGILSLVTAEDSTDARNHAALAKPWVQLLAGHFHQALFRISRTRAVASPVLTERERECLRWTADGKTSWEIAQLLKTSERTVNFHLNNVMLKLNVSNRPHAVAKAVLQGVVRPLSF